MEPTGESGINHEIKAQTEFQTREELPHTPENQQVYEAIVSLIDMGMLIPVNKLELYHGRVGKAVGGEWTVDPSFENHGNSTGNNNVHNRSTLYTSDFQTAREFAVTRAAQEYSKTQRDTLHEQIKNYTAEERAEWLERLNQDRVPFSEVEASDLQEGAWGFYSRAREETEALALRQSRSALEKGEALTEEIKAEVHAIVSRDPLATVIDREFDITQLSDEQKASFQQALVDLVIPITEGSPLPFSESEAGGKFTAFLRSRSRSPILSSDVASIAKDFGISEQVALQLASAYNSYLLAGTNPKILADRLLRYQDTIIIDKVPHGDGTVKAPLNLEYAERYLQHAHIVGAKHSVESATLRRTIETVSLYDLHKVGTISQLEQQRDAMYQKMQGLLETFFPLTSDSEKPEIGVLFSLLTDPHVKPEHLITAAKEIGEYRHIYEADAGNWEGFTLEEHTETVLRNFDENFADTLPVEYLVPMRLAILVHDLGKPMAVNRDEKYKQKIYNSFYAKSFLNEIGIDPAMRNFIVSIITDGSDLAFKQQKANFDAQSNREMQLYAEDILKQFLGTDAIKEDQICAYEEMCRMFQLCDGGAYTSMAITRRPGESRFRNHPSFNASFENPRGLRKRDIRYRSN